MSEPKDPPRTGPELLAEAIDKAVLAKYLDARKYLDALPVPDGRGIVIDDQGTHETDLEEKP